MSKIVIRQLRWFFSNTFERTDQSVLWIRGHNMIWICSCALHLINDFHIILSDSVQLTGYHHKKFCEAVKCITHVFLLGKSCKNVRSLVENTIMNVYLKRWWKICIINSDGLMYQIHLSKWFNTEFAYFHVIHRC